MKVHISRITFLLLFTLLCSSAIDATKTTSQELIEKPMVVGIPSYNNKEWCVRSLDSVFSQKYKNFRVIYVDDASSDGTGYLVQEYIVKHGLQDRITYICNDKRSYAMHNWYKIVHLCNDDEIVVNLDGDDELAHENVLSRLNEVYSKEGVWVTYGQFMNVQTDVRGYCSKVPDHIVRKNNFRKFGWRYAALRTYYAWLFKLIKVEDFFYNGEFLKVCCDHAIMYPILEMAGERHKFIPEILYLRNLTGFNDRFIYRNSQKVLEKIIPKWPRYKRLESKPKK